MVRVLLIEDDPAVAEGLALGLRRQGYQADVALTGEDGLAKLTSFRPDLVVLDLMLPGIDGFEVCRRIRTAGTLPVIMLTARNDDMDIVIGLEAGADDYVVKPVQARVLEARIRAVLRRTEAAGPQTRAEVHGELALDRAALTVTKSGRPVALAPSELRLLLELSSSPGRVFTRGQLLESVWGHPYLADGRLVDACVKRLRIKIEDPQGPARYIQTVRGFGYRFGPV
ncbi:response regulator transcription factor [Streptomyces sp. SID3343]|uniref:response regulator transcription factor n=1 Tax=Streptomyces sp. SID3343 TaxID=2690260 RepID=UPI00136CC815|nr:response regulator transcription factor [Streptomyces sp. SID3343]MYV99301.1 response regulator [Streptomyces sp. SID3343]